MIISLLQHKLAGEGSSDIDVYIDLLGLILKKDSLHLYSRVVTLNDFVLLRGR